MLWLGVVVVSHLAAPAAGLQPLPLVGWLGFSEGS
eukprot:COSAG01_NODE_45434_length_409_cov_1.164516_1_plen_34_part_10